MRRPSAAAALRTLSIPPAGRNSNLRALTVARRRARSRSAGWRGGQPQLVAPGRGLLESDLVRNRPGEVHVEDPEGAIIAANEECRHPHRQLRTVGQHRRDLAGREAAGACLPAAKTAELPRDAPVMPAIDSTHSS